MSAFRFLLPLILTTLHPTSADALKILLFCPGVSKSHVMFNYRLASTLISRGHEVVVYNQVIFEDALAGSKPPLNVKEIRQKCPPLDPERLAAIAASRRSLQDLVWTDSYSGRLLGPITSMFQFGYFKDLISSSCEAALENQQLLDELRDQKFDMALSHYMFLCPLAISKAIGIKKVTWISANSFTFVHAATVMGIPVIPSYLPSILSGSMDRMTFSERVQNFAMDTISFMLTKLPVNHEASEEEIFQSTVGNQSQTLKEMALEMVQNLLINGEPLLSYPRPYVPETRFLGDLDTQTKVEELNEEWKREISSGRDGVIVFSLGTVGNTSIMPLEMKRAFFEAFKKFPTYKIIWRIEGPLPFAVHNQTHIKIVSWLPQRLLLHSGSVKLFITHGGYNSLVETTQAGIPVLLLPLFGDQYGNAKLAVRYGLGLELSKSTLDAADISNKMNALLTDPRFSDRAKKFAHFMQDKLVPNADVAVRQIGTTLKNRWPRSKARILPLIKIFNLDIIACCMFLMISLMMLICSCV